MKQTRRNFVRTLFVASQAVIASRFIPGTLLADTVSGNGLKFMVFGDWGRNGERDQVEVAAQMTKAARDLKPKFIISVGDNFYENGVASATDPQWQSSFEKVYHDPALQVPWNVALGNHDYNGNCDAQIEYGKANPRWNMPARYFIQSHIVADGVTADFFYIDTTPMLKSAQKSRKLRDHVATQDVPKQLAWLKDSLAASKAQWKIVVGHHPIYSGGAHGDTQELIENILPLLHEHKVQVYFNGHDHDLQHLTAGEVNLFDSGAGSQVRRPKMTKHSKFAAGASGFTTVALNADKMSVGMIDNRGKLLYSTEVLRT